MKVETKVGILFLLACVLVAGFAFVMGVLNPFGNYHLLHVQYNFAGGIEVGSPVRVMGIKVGKVKEIRFSPDMRDKDGQEVKLRITISVDKKAWETVRSDSQFFINLAGVIGEKFLEVTPGTLEAPALTPGDTVRGIDPPRIDQLISQSYGLAGQIIEFVKKNEGSVTNTLQLMEKLVTNVNKTLVLLDKTTGKGEVSQLMKNMIELTDQLNKIAGKVNSPDGQKTAELVHRLIWRLDDLDKAAIKKFLQEEGIRAKLF